MAMMQTWCSRCKRLRPIVVVVEVGYLANKEPEARRVVVTLGCGHGESPVMTPTNILRAREQQTLARRYLTAKHRGAA